MNNINQDQYKYNLLKQSEEVETLTSIYGEEFQIEDQTNKAYSINIVYNCDTNLYAKLYVKFPETYPSIAPPIFEISAPHLKQEHKIFLYNLLEKICLSNIGENIIFELVEKIREEISFIFSQSSNALYNKNLERIDVKEINVSVSENKVSIHPEIEIVHGDVIVDRKSSFQGHAATVHSIHQVRQVIMKLKENRKIQQAKHNIYAYRIYNEIEKTFVHDCDDDGENQAGSRLLHLLEIVKAKDVVVVVSRWYGGIHLGPDRFRHINNAARQVLAVAKLI